MNNDQSKRKSEPSSGVDFEKFLLTEYDNIANAHFNIVNTLTTFFKHYLLIVSLPLPFLGAALAKPEDNTVLTGLVDAMPFIAFVISVLGILIAAYITNLRFEAVLYARTVNGIRLWFYRRSLMSLIDERNIRVLPTSTIHPKYYEKSYFLCVILAFGIINATYATTGIYQLCNNALEWSVLIFLFVLLLQIRLYWHSSKKQSGRYLRSYSWSIGIDIDGVLNNHREHFCEYLKVECGKDLHPAMITHIPVREMPTADITKDDEFRVFNNPNYWKDMPVAGEAALALREIKRTLCVRVVLFTSLPWPVSSCRSIQKRWRKENKLWSQKSAMEHITRVWLKKHDIAFDDLVVERKQTPEEKKRFFRSRCGEFAIFVEDDLDKATKLAAVCNLVFLIDHPYNQTTDLPQNIIRVENWSELTKKLQQSIYSNGAIELI